MAKGAHICILNPDTVVAEDTFDCLLNFSKHAKNMGIVGCQLVDGGCDSFVRALGVHWTRLIVDPGLLTKHNGVGFGRSE